MLLICVRIFVKILPIISVIWMFFQCHLFVLYRIELKIVFN